MRGVDGDVVQVGSTGRIKVVKYVKKSATVKN